MTRTYAQLVEVFKAQVAQVQSEDWPADFSVQYLKDMGCSAEEIAIIKSDQFKTSVNKLLAEVAETDLGRQRG
jgi:hypothetical protein